MRILLITLLCLYIGYEYIYKEIDYETYDKVCWSWWWDKTFKDYPICLFNHDEYKNMKELKWTQKYLLLE